MIALDTNVLVAAHRRDAQWHARAAEAVRGLAEGGQAFALPWPCLHEFIAVVTHPRIFPNPSSPAQALAQVHAWLGSPQATLLAETPGYWAVLHELLGSAQATGPRVHDARVAALCLHHGVSELWSVDRDFGRFPKLRVRNPLVP